MTVAAIADPIQFRNENARVDLFAALMRAKKQYGGPKTAIVDGDERKMSYGEIIQAAFALGHALKKGTKIGENVAILLPTGAGAVIAFYALEAFGRVPAMLNFTAGAKNLTSALQAAEVKRIITAHQFIEIGGLEPLVDALKDKAEFVYLEDVRENLGLADKIAGAVGPIAPWLIRSKSSH